MRPRPPCLRSIRVSLTAVVVNGCGQAWLQLCADRALPLLSMLSVWGVSSHWQNHTTRPLAELGAAQESDSRERQAMAAKSQHWAEHEASCCAPNLRVCLLCAPRLSKAAS